jgi:hypothetical protein
MRVKCILAAFACMVLCFRSLAISVPHTMPMVPAFEDTSVRKYVSVSSSSAHYKKPGFFGKLKNKVLAYAIAHQPGAKSKASTKAVLGLVALGLVGLCLGLIAAGASGAFLGWMFIAGVVIAIISLCMPKTETEKVEKKRSNSAAILVLSIAAGVLLLAILLVASLNK